MIEATLGLTAFRIVLNAISMRDNELAFRVSAEGYSSITTTSSVQHRVNGIRVPAERT